MKNHSLYLFIIITVNMLLYYSLIDFDFQYQWDDQWQVINPMTQEGFTRSNVEAVLTTTFRGQYSPVNQLIYIFIYNVAGFSPAYFHALNLMFHIANCILIYFMVSYLFSLNIMHLPKFKFIAFAVSFLYSVHPLNVESVCWISASKIVLGTFFFLLTIILYIKYKSSKIVIFYIFSVLMSLMALGCKEQFIVLLPILILINKFIFKERVFDLWNYISILPYLLITSIIIYICFACNKGLFDFNVLNNYTLFDRLLFLSYSLFSYILMGILPIKLSYIYPFIYDEFTFSSSIYVIYPFILLFLVYVLYLNRHNSFLLFMSLLFILQLLPVLHIIPLPRNAIIADRYMYNSLVPLLCILVYGAYCLKEKLLKHKPFLQCLFLGCFFVYTIYLASYTYQYKFVWKNSICLKESAINKGISIF